ncbi:substrate-binding periplasmic protein, partial [Magnetococcales bacterium HHB-1]
MLKGRVKSTLIIIVVIFLTGCSNGNVPESRQSAFERITDVKKINIGYIVFPPTITKNPNTGELDGHFVKTIKEICRQAGWKPNFIETDWKGFSAGLKSKRFDLSIAPTFVTVPRALSVAFTRPLFFAGNSAIVRKNETRFSDVDVMSLDRQGVTVSVTQGSAAHEFAKAN